MRNYGVLAVGVLVSVFSVACGSAKSGAAEPSSPSGDSRGYAPAAEAAPGAYPAQPGYASPDAPAAAGIPGFPAPAGAPAAASPMSASATSPARVAEESKSSSSPITVLPRTAPEPRRLPQAGQLTAGIWDDNLNFDFFKPYASTFRSQNPDDLSMFAQQEMETARDQANKSGSAHGDLDVQLVLDTTGSMGDELSYLQSEFDSIAARLKTKFPNVTPRWSLVVYRDKGDDYVTRDFDFTTDTNKFRTNLRAQSAGGGGDIPEAVVQGLETGARMNWRPAGSVAKVAFWVADAPAHPGEGKQLATVVRNLKAKGVHVYPIASSDTNDTAEYQMRSTAQLTGGRYVFLTNDSGVGNSHAEPHIPCYAVTRLDSAIIRAIDTEITGQRHEAPSEDVVRNVGQPDKTGKCKLASGALVASF